MSKFPFCGMTPGELEKIITDHGIGHIRALTVVTNYYRRGIHDFSNMENMSKQIRTRFKSFFSDGIIPPVKSEVSSDGSEKYLFILDSGKKIETVRIPDRNRNTVCVSTQSGCRMGCPFCLTGQSGFRGDLTSGEIINQVLSVQESSDISHVVFMGMGEPMDNLEEVIQACEILTSGWGLALSPRNVTVSTVGITPSVKRFLEVSDCNLTLSLFSPFSDERADIVPSERLYPAMEIIDMMRVFPLQKKRRFSVAYVMIEDVNDSERHLKGLIGILKGSPIRINLLPYHAVQGEKFVSSSGKRMLYFRDILMKSGVSASIRRSRGTDISAACGLLASGLGSGN